MKQSGFRLVQRKFAQGVPIPASSSPAAPPPPEKKTEPPCPPRSVYHNNMSARSLLDIVTLQNLHRHKQEPLVLLKRLREDEIQSAFSHAKLPARKRRGLKAAKNKMALRSGKRKSPEAPKFTIKRRKKNNSESTDDVPLAFYDAEKRKQAQANKEKLSKRETRSRTEEQTEKRTPNGQEKRKKLDDPRTRAIERGPAVKRQERNGPTMRRLSKFSSRSESTDHSEESFAFKEPRNPIRMSYRGFKEQRAAAAAAKGRYMRTKARCASKVRTSPRVSTQRSASEEIGVANRLRNKQVLAEKPLSPAVREPSAPTPIKVDPSLSENAGPPVNDVPAVPPVPLTMFDVPRFSMDSNGAQYDASLVIAGVIKTLNVDMSTPTTDILNELRSNSTNSRDWCIEGSADKEIDRPSVKIEPSDTVQSTPVTSIASSVREESEKRNKTSDKQITHPPNKTNTQTKSTTSNQTKETTTSTQRETTTSTQTRETTTSIQLTEITTSSQTSETTTSTQPTETTTSSQTSVPATNSTEQYDDSELDPLNVVKENMKMEKRNIDGAKQKGKRSVEIKKDTVEKRSSRNSSLKQKPVGKNTQHTLQNRNKSRQTATEPDHAKGKIMTRGSKTNTRDTITRLLRNTSEPSQAPAIASPDVYEFDAEREASGPPSGLRTRRNQPEPSQPILADKHKELLEYFTAPKRESTSSVPSTTTRDIISDEKKRALIINLASSPLLFEKFLSYLSPEIQTELDNFITTEAASGSLNKTDVKSEYLDLKTGSLMEALTFHPTEEEFADPILYFEKIAPQASLHGLCKIVPPPSFKPPCNISDTIRFAVIYQYISKMYSRWGPVTRELAAIKAHLRTQSVVFARSPLLDGSEVNLPKLYHVVERHGGLNNVMQRKRWGRVADEMKLTKLQHPERKLDPIYMRYLLPYATLSDKERQAIMSEVEKYWTLKYQKMLKRARNPFQRQARMLSAETENESSDDERDDTSTAGALREAEDCIVPGRAMNLATFKKVATALMDAQFEPKSQPPNPIEVEKAYWRAVLLGTEHIVANTASIDTGEEGYGFPKDPEAEYGSHPWNLKGLARNPNNVLRYLGEVLGVTVPTLQLSMLFSTSCWHRDPHGLPWIEYMHSGAEKIWYGIPRDESANFRRAVETLCPAYCQNKSIWLASEITMIPPNILSEHQVRLSRLIQRPGEYVLVFPEAHSCSITTGFGISESVYFASNAWVSAVYKLFQELRNSCEPTMFSLEQLLVDGSKDESAPAQLFTVLCTLLGAELEHRRALERKGLHVQQRPPSGLPLNTSYFRAWNTRAHDECEYCRSTLYLSKVIGLTGRNSAVCPEHALRLLETKKHKNVDVSTLDFLSPYSSRTLEEMVEKLENRSGQEQELVIDLTAPSPVPTVGSRVCAPGTSRQARD